MLRHMKFPLGSSVKCTLRKQQVTLGVVCALLCNFFESTGGECFRIIPDVTEPQQVELHVWSICFPCWHFSMRCIFARKLLQHFALVLALSHGKQILRSIKVEFQCGDLHKYAGKRKTHGQIHGQLHGGCCSRALQLTRKVLYGGFTFVLTISMRQGVST